MAPKPKATSSALKKSTKPGSFLARDGLGAYLQDPSAFPPSRVIYHTEKWVVINDLYPKSSVHILLLARGEKACLHPFDAFEDSQFLADVQTEVRSLKALVAKELQRKYGKYSAQDKVREDAMDAEPPPDQLPAGRDWDKEVICGVHAHPSMNHLHVHILSVDRMSECMKKIKHYNSFATPFLVDVADFPLAENDVRRHPGREGYLARDLKCWKCGQNFGNKFTRLKKHLAEEFEQWKRL